MAEQTKFDRGAAEFSITMSHVANWKDSYFGAAYSTRLRQAIKDARTAADRMEKILDADEEVSGTKEAESA